MQGQRSRQKSTASQVSSYMDMVKMQKGGGATPAGAIYSVQEEEAFSFRRNGQKKASGSQMMLESHH